MSIAVAPPPRAVALTSHVLRDVTELEALRPEWEELLHDSAADEVTLAPDWLLTWFDVFGGTDGRELRTIAWRDEDGRLAGLAPLLLRSVRHRGIVPLRRLEPLGAGEPEADSICTEYLNLIARRGLERIISDALTTALRDGSLGNWDEFVLPHVASDNPMTAVLADSLQRGGLPTTMQVTGAAPYVPLPATWDDYLKALPSNDRYFARRTLRDFETWAGGPVQMEYARTPDELERGNRILIDLHHNRWSEVGAEAGVFRSERFLAFHRTLMPRLLARGELELTWLTAHGRPVAAVYNFVRAGKVSYYQCGRVTDVPAKVRPGVAILLLLIRSHIEAGRREFDFLGGDYRYKKQLALATRDVMRLRTVRPGWRESMRQAVEQGVQSLRSIRAVFRKA